MQCLDTVVANLRNRVSQEEIDRQDILTDQTPKLNNNRRTRAFSKLEKQQSESRDSQEDETDSLNKNLNTYLIDEN